MTHEAFAALEEDDRYRFELSGGLLVCEPQPAPLHARVALRLGQRLARHVEEQGVGAAFDACGYLLSRDPDTVRAPDLSFVAGERLADVPEGITFLPFPPDLAVEVLSPSNRPREVHAKIAELLAAGTRLVWIVDPSKRTVAVYRTLLAPKRLDERGVLDGEDVLPGFSVAVAELFRA